MCLPADHTALPNPQGLLVFFGIFNVQDKSILGKITYKTIEDTSYKAGDLKGSKPYIKIGSRLIEYKRKYT